MIIFNAIILGSEHHDMSDLLHQIHDISNYIFTAIFFFEMIVKLIAFSPSGYIKDGFNVFDGIIVIAGIVDIILSVLTTSNNYSLVAFRAFRVMRAFKVFNNWTSIQVLLRIIQRSLVRIGSISLILLLFLLVFGTTARALFGDHELITSYHHPRLIRSRYHSLWLSTVTMFQILTGDDWIYILGEGMERRGYIGGIFIFIVYIVGGFFGINMFIAIILLGFEEDEKEKTATHIEKSLNGYVHRCISSGEEFIVKDVMIKIYKSWEKRRAKK